MIECRRRPWRIALLCLWLCTGFALGTCGNGCARPVEQTPARVESPVAAERHADVYVEEPRLSDEEP